MSYQLVLLCSDVGSPPAFESAVSAVAYLAQSSHASVVVSPYQAAVNIVVEAHRRLSFPCHFDVSWCAQRDAFSHAMPESQLTSQIQQLEASSNLSELPIEDRSAFTSRLTNAVFSPHSGVRLVVAPLGSIAACAEVMGSERREPPMLSIWTVDTQGQKCTNKLWMRSVHEFVKLTPNGEPESPKPSLLSEPPKTAENPEHGANSDFWVVEECMIPLFKEILQKRFPRSSAFAQANATVEHVETALQKMNARLQLAVEKLDQEVREAGADNETISALLTTLHDLSAVQSTLEQDLDSLTAAVTSRVSTLHSRLASLQQVQESQITPSIPAYTPGVSPPLLHIESVEYTSDFHLVAKVKSRKQYPVLGFLQIEQAGARYSASSNAISFERNTEIILQTVMAVPAGKCELSVVHFLNYSEISDKCEFEGLAVEGGVVDREFAETAIGRSGEKLAWAEEAMRGKMGEEGVQLLQALSLQWQNEDESGVDQFLMVCADEALRSEAEIRDRLNQYGFQL